MEKLTKRECEVLGLMAKGMSNKEIMEKLCISRGTLTRHICNVYGKLGIDGTTDEYSVKRLRAALWYLKLKTNIQKQKNYQIS